MWDKRGYNRDWQSWQKLAASPPGFVFALDDDFLVHPVCMGTLVISVNAKEFPAVDRLAVKINALIRLGVRSII